MKIFRYGAIQIPEGWRIFRKLKVKNLPLQNYFCSKCGKEYKSNGKFYCPKCKSKNIMKIAESPLN